MHLPSRILLQIAHLVREQLFYQPIRFNHSVERIFQQVHHAIHIVAVKEDNYSYVIIDTGTKEAAAVDPIDPDKIQVILDKEKAEMKAILTTHHLPDHAGGNNQMKVKFSNIPIYGGDKRVQGVSKIVKSGDQIKVGTLRIKCLFEPKETSGHVCYYLRSNGEEYPCAFVGDTLFVGGAGDYPECNLQQMYKAIMEVIGSLPDHTFIFCGHENAVDNLEFALSIDPFNVTIKDKLKWAKEQRELKAPTVPTILEEERMYNPFLRLKQESLQIQCKTTNAKDTLAFLREKKKKWKETKAKEKKGKPEDPAKKPK